MMAGTVVVMRIYGEFRKINLRKVFWLKLDSGADVNIIDSDVFERLSRVERLLLSSTNIRLYPYGCEKLLKLRGKVHCSVDFEGKSVLTDIYVVVNRSSGCLLGKDTAKSLVVMKLVDSILEVCGISRLWLKDFHQFFKVLVD